MGKNRKTDLPWRVQWHVTADGMVIQQRARGDHLHEQLFQNFATTRPVTVAEMDALSGRVEHELRRVGPFQVLWWTGMVVFVAGFTLGGGLVLQRMSGEFSAGLVVGAVLGLLFLSPAFRLVAVSLPMDSGGSLQRLWQEAGIASPGVTMNATEARALIEAPGTTSGIETRAKRA